MSRWNNRFGTNEDIFNTKRTAIIRAAGKAFGRKGFHNTTLEDVAKELNVSKATLYNYVHDKYEILYECHLSALAIGGQAFATATDKSHTGAERLRKALQIYITDLLLNMGACAALTEVDALPAEQRRTIVAKRDFFQARMIDVMNQGIADGSLKKVDAKIAVFTFMGAINWIPRWFSDEGPIPAGEVAEKVVEILMSGLATKKTKGSHR